MLNRFKAIISTALVAVLLLTLFPLASFAADPNIKFTVTKQVLSEDELDEIDPGDDEHIGDTTDLHPVPLIVRVGVSGSGELVGADFSVTFEGDKLEFARTLSYTDSILDDTANIAVSSAQSIVGSNKKRINISFFVTDSCRLTSQGGSVIYLMFYVKKNPNSAGGKYFHYGKMNFDLVPEYVGYLDNNDVKIIKQNTPEYQTFLSVTVSNNILTDTPAPITSLEIVKQPPSYAVNKSATSFRIPDSDIVVRGRRANGTTKGLFRDDSGYSADSYKVSNISLATAGDKTITITCKDAITGQTITLKHTVKVVSTSGKTVSSITVTPPTNLYNTVGKALDTTGLKVTAKYSDNTTATVTDYTLSGYNKDKVGDQTITVTYSGKTATFKVYVSPNRGDIDNNGKIDAADARLVLRYVAKLDKSSEAVAKAMDCDQDGKVSASDARKILRYVAKLDKTF